MTALHPLPRIWLFTDARNRVSLFDSVRHLPRLSGVVFRDYDLPEQLRADRLRKVSLLCRQYGHVLLVAGQTIPGEVWLADGSHNRGSKRHGMLSCAVHDSNQLSNAIRMNADLVFISPIFATKSHPEQPPLGPRDALLLASIAPMPAIALGGMTAERFDGQLRRGFYGWGAIEALSRSV